MSQEKRKAIRPTETGSCSHGDCPSFDGKRCSILGYTVCSGSACQPYVEQLKNDLVEAGITIAEQENRIIDLIGERDEARERWAKATDSALRAAEKAMKESLEKALPDIEERLKSDKACWACKTEVKNVVIKDDNGRAVCWFCPDCGTWGSNGDAAGWLVKEIRRLRKEMGVIIEKQDGLKDADLGRMVRSLPIGHDLSRVEDGWMVVDENGASSIFDTPEEAISGGD